jgi:class 3 adenylate cyclase/tetratricopeptide (TPR) repeat protein
MDLRSERRVVTALFIDVVGSTDLMMRVGPEVMRRRMADAFGQMSARIAEHGGTVENYAGDAIFAIFGAPTARTDDPERALRAAHACAEWSRAGLGDDRLSIRVGIETGEALVDLDAVGRHERMAIGSCVNVAARLQQHADAGDILAGPTAQSATAALANFEPLGRLTLKGVGEVDGWRFVDFAQSAEIPSVPFVGRQQELATLTEAAARSTRGEQIMALITGSPGLGKSRLLGELLRSRRAGGNVQVIELRCRPAGEEGSNTPLRQLAEAEVPNANPDAIRARLNDLLGAEVAGVTSAAILHSTGLEPSPALLAISRYEQRTNIAEAWRRYLTALARQQPLILAVEDVHWADPVLVFMLYHVTARGDAPLLVVATARPEFAGSPLIRAGESLVQVELQPLDAGAAVELAEAARGTIAGLDRAAGNPLFIIELARAQSTAASDDVPLTIQAAIAARLDELSPDERQLLQQVSVAGETFDVRDAALLTDREPAEVAGLLGRIAHLGFVEFAGRAYRFHHALAHDVAYSRLPVSNRMQLHARYADEGVAPGDEIGLAFHLWQAARPPDAGWVWDDADRFEVLRKRALDAQLAAAKQLETWNQYEQAEDVYARAVELASDSLEKATALAGVGRAQRWQGKGDDAWKTRLASIDAYREAGTDPPAVFYADMLDVIAFNWGYYHDLPSDEQVVRLLADGLTVARSTGDKVSLARLLMERASLEGVLEGTDEVIAFVESDQALQFADAAHRLAEVLMWNGEFDRALDLYRRVFDDLLPRGALINEPEALIWYTLTNFWAGDINAAAATAERASADLAKGRSVHTRSHVMGMKSLVAIGRGDWSGLLKLTDELEAMLVAHPTDAFCLIGASAVGFGGAARLLSGIDLPNDLAKDAARMVEGSELIQASSILLPEAILGDDAAVDRGAAAYAPGLRLFDRANVTDPLHLIPALAAVMTERWEMLDAPIATMEYCAAHGSRLAAAALEAIVEERSGSDGSRHEQLRALGYNGISELLRIRARTLQPTSA